MKGKPNIFPVQYMPITVDKPNCLHNIYQINLLYLKLKQDQLSNIKDYRKKYPSNYPALFKNLEAQLVKQVKEAKEAVSSCENAMLPLSV